MMFSSTPAPSQTDTVFDKHAQFHSSALRQGWYSTSQRALAVQTNDGAVYQYSNVDREDWSDLVAARSAGQAWADIRQRYGHSSQRLYDVPEYKPGAATSLSVPVESTTARKSGYQANVAVTGTFTVHSDATDFLTAADEIKKHLDRKFKDTGLTFVIQSVERV